MIYVNVGWRGRKKKQNPAKARKPKLEFSFQDEPVQTEPVWNVYADEGQGFRPVGQHHGDPASFNPWGDR